MPVSDSEAPWLLLTFTLPAKRASDSVKVWRKLQRYGAVPLGNSGYLLPHNPSNQEHFEWMATAIRRYAGEASVVKVQSIDNLSTHQLVGRFAEARAREYQDLIRELQKVSTASRDSPDFPCSLHKTPGVRLPQLHNYSRSATEALVPGEAGGSFCWCYIWRRGAAASP